MTRQNKGVSNGSHDQVNEDAELAMAYQTQKDLNKLVEINNK